MSRPVEHLPGEPASHSGPYELLNVFGSPTGVVVTHAKEGEPLPIAPRGFTWRHVPEEDGA